MWFGYMDIVFALLCFYFLRRLKNINGGGSGGGGGGLWNWPVLGMLPGLLCNLHRTHDWLVGVLRSSGGTFLFKGPCFAGMDSIVTADPANVHFIMSDNFTNFPKGRHFRKIFDVLGGGIFNADGESWRRQRKQARAAITHDVFRRFLIRTTWEKVETGLIPVLEHAAKQGMVIDLQDVFQRFTFDTTCRFVAGVDPGCLAVELPHVQFSKAMDDAQRAIFMRHILPRKVSKIGKLLRIGHEEKLRQACTVMDRVIRRYTDMKRNEIKLNKSNQEGEQGVDLLTTYINKGDESLQSDKSLRDTILNFMIAGRDTTSSALTWFIWLVSTHPEIEKKIRDELNAVIPEKETQKWRIFKMEELQNLTYLHAALCESLRLYPPVPFQHKAPVNPVILPSGHYVDSKLEILFSLYSMARMEFIWGIDAKEFKPERWIGERGTIKHEPSYKFLAFNAGPRTCLGKEVAFTQLKAVAAAMIHNYKVEVVKGHKIAPNISIILYMKHGLKVRITKRWI